MNHDNDRRRFFRITDTLGVTYRVLDHESEPLDAKAAAVDALQLIASYNETIEASMNALRGTPAIVDAIDALNKKLDCILAQLELDNLMTKKVAHNVKEVNISAFGMAFMIDESLSSDTLLHLDLVFKPENLHVMAKAKVIDCDLYQDDAYYLRVEFLEMSQADQERLIQHIVQRQGILLRSLRDM